MAKVSRFPDVVAILISGSLAYAVLTSQQIATVDKAFAAIVSLLGILLCWRLLRRRGWFIKIAGYTLVVLLLLLLQGAISDYLMTHFSR